MAQTLAFHKGGIILPSAARGCQELRELFSLVERGQAFCVTDAGVEPAAGGVTTFQTQTGGTSGEPKRVVRSHRSWIASFAVTADLWGVGAGSRYAMFGGLQHSLSLYAALEAMHLGAELLLLDGLRPDRQGAAVQQYRPDVIYATPSQLRMLAGMRQRFDSVRRLFVGGGRLDVPTREMVASLMPEAQIHVFYGASETSFIALDRGDAPVGSVGSAYPGVDLKIGEDGQIWVKSPYLFDGYATGCDRGVAWDDGYLSLGEMGRVDAQGYLYVEGRRDRVFTVADQNVHPEVVEEVLRACPGVADAAVIGRPDLRRGAVPVAFVMGDVESELVEAHCRTRLTGIAIPREIILVDAMPMLPSGKIDYRALHGNLS